jgi:hypothetical protein
VIGKMATKGSGDATKVLPFRYQFGAGAVAGISEVRYISHVHGGGGGGRRRRRF